MLLRLVADSMALLYPCMGTVSSGIALQKHAIRWQSAQQMHYNKRMKNTTTPRSSKQIKRARVLVRVTDAQRAAWERMGGAKWLRAMLDAVPENALQKDGK